MAEETVPSVSEVARLIEQARRDREKQDRSFELGGETFTFLPAASMDIISEYLDMNSGRTDSSNVDAVAILDRTMLGCLEPGQEEKWLKVRNDKQHPLSVADVHMILEAMVGVATARPTLPPSGSTGGQESNGTNSKADSPSKELT